jgi:hypothetical protein
MSQGQLFYEQFISTSQLWNGQLSVNGVLNCPTTEDVEHGSVTAGGFTYGQLTAYKALEADMTSNLSAPSCAAMGSVRASQN